MLWDDFILATSIEARTETLAQLLRKNCQVGLEKYPYQKVYILIKCDVMSWQILVSFMFTPIHANLNETFTSYGPMFLTVWYELLARFMPRPRATLQKEAEESRQKQKIRGQTNVQKFSRSRTHAAHVMVKLSCMGTAGKSWEMQRSNRRRRWGGTYVEFHACICWIFLLSAMSS